MKPCGYSHRPPQALLADRGEKLLKITFHNGSRCLVVVIFYKGHTDLDKLCHFANESLKQSVGAVTHLHIPILKGE